MEFRYERANQAKAFIKKQARPLEQFLLDYFFEGGRKEDVFYELAKFQNEDGGFGKALEPDLQLPQSSAIATVRGFQILSELKAPQEHDLVQSAIRYLWEIYDAEKKVWPIIPSILFQGKQAPWWTFHKDLEGSWRGFQSNPRGEILACLYRYPELSLEGRLDTIAEDLVLYLEEKGEEMEMHDFLSCSYLLEQEVLPPALQERMLKCLTPIFQQNTSQDPSQWGGYGLRPLQLVTSPHSPLKNLFPESVLRANLEYELEAQEKAGCWSPPWSWEGEAWKSAKEAWQGILTLKMLRIFKHFS